MITFTHKGDFSKLSSYLKKIKNLSLYKTLEKYGEAGVDALKKATPVDTGLTASSWYYKITVNNETSTLSFYNSNVQDGVPIAIILQYGHATRNGGWVKGRDYINPAIQPIFDKIAKDAWAEVTKL